MKNYSYLFKHKLTLKTFFIVSVFLFSATISTGQDVEIIEEVVGINDCPYVFYQDDTVVVKWVENDFIREKIFTIDDFKTFKIPACKEFKPQYLNIKPDFEIDNKQEYKNVSKIAMLSDIHGQYDLFIQLLQANKIINERNEWIYGDGHFVIVGDIFDRGEHVTETLWFIYNLEQQAALAGGKVHYLLGNHEIMILEGNQKYVNEKYKWVAKGMGVTYKELFSKETLLGAWIRTKPIAITINDIAFAHAGFSPEFIDGDFDIEKANELFHEQIIDVVKKEVLDDDDLKFMVKKNGPIWYRGYFKDNEFTKEKVMLILKALNKKHIVVGHTSMHEVLSHFDGLIYSVDSSMKHGESAEILMWEDGSFFKGTLSGLKIAM